MEPTGDPEYECEICDKVFNTKSALTSHKRIHKEYHKCEICDKCFTGSQALIEHERIHTGENPFECYTNFLSNSFALSRTHIMTTVSLVENLSFI